MKKKQNPKTCTYMWGNTLAYMFLVIFLL